MERFHDGLPTWKRWCCCAVLLASSSLSTAAYSQSRTDIKAKTIPEIAQIERSKSARDPVELKMTSKVREWVLGITTNFSPAKHKLANPHVAANTGQETQELDIRADVSDGLLDYIKAKGGHVENSSPDAGSIRARIPRREIRDLAGRSDVKFLKKAAGLRTNDVRADLEGVAAHNIQAARDLTHSTGKDVRVCVMSDSIDDSHGALASAEVSGAIDAGKLHIMGGQEGVGAGEGLAMSEIVHAIAPDAEIYFATGEGGPIQMAENIYAFRVQGCEVIVDDLTYDDESPFQEDFISAAVKDVSDSGILYFSSARNSGNIRHNTSSTWEGDFRDGGPADKKFKGAGTKARMHTFDGRITLNTVDVADGKDRVDLFWSDPLGQSRNGYDLFIVDKAGNVVDSSTTVMTGSQDPYQSVDHISPGQSIVIVKTGSAAPRFIHLDVGRARIRHGTNGSVRGHNASGASNAFSVAAERAPNPNGSFVGGGTVAVEEFSSDGPRRVFYSSRGVPLTPGNYSSTGGILFAKPDITAADGVTTSFPDGSELNKFYGTSAAAPHAGGIAALLLSCKNRPTPSEVRKALQSTALRIDGTDTNVTAGYGVIMADAAASNVCRN